MNITKLIIVETIIYTLIAFLVHTFFVSKTNDPIFKIINVFFWGTLIILSILINTQKFLFFITTFIILILLSIIFIIKYNIKKYFKNKLYYGVYMLIGITFFGIFNFIVTKYFIYNIVNTEPPIGNNGELGKLGETGTNYSIENFSERCYVDIINYLEKEYEAIKKTNNIDYDIKDYGINNLYLKDNIKRICYSNDFYNEIYDIPEDVHLIECVYNENENENHRKCNKELKNGVYVSCDKNTDCYNGITEDDSSYNTYNINEFNTNEYKIQRNYNKTLEVLKKETKYWLKLILKNNCDEDTHLKNKLGRQDYEDLKETSQENNLFYNSRIGHQFLNDYFQNDIYLKDNLDKSPFVEIKKRDKWKWGYGNYK